MKITGFALLCLATTAAAFSALPQQSSSRWSSEMQMSATTLGKPGTAEIGTPWEELGFEFLPTNSHVRITYKDGEWGPTELVKVSF
jgi:hypothetical protein